ncbi:hypothetical protein AGR8A_Cc60229 [Agrobacterium fabrum str. J-07]|nr:hypothetical protein AGR8A_Cc60229 [Agrobacterium fabrum str. J-07]
MFPPFASASSNFAKKGCERQVLFDRVTFEGDAATGLLMLTLFGDSSTGRWTRPRCEVI